VKYGSAGKCRRKFRDERVPSRQTIHNLVDKLRKTGHPVSGGYKYGDLPFQDWGISILRQ
jgi:hypothetical protein